MSRTSGTSQNTADVFTLAKQTALYQQYMDKKFCDLVITIKDEEFFVHTCIIAATCPKLQNLIDERKVNVDFPDRPQMQAELDDGIFSAKVFGFLLEYMYLGVLDWSKVAPNLVNQLLGAASWCEFYQLIEDYMSSNQDEDQDAGLAGSTIIMVDTGEDSDKGDEEETEHSETFEINVIDQTDKTLSDTLIDDKEALYCMFCGLQFDFGDEIALAEHMQTHENKSIEDTCSRRNVTRRKASLGLKKKYKSLIPNYKEDQDLSDSDDDHNNIKQETVAKTSRASKNKGKVSLFKHTHTCQYCNKKMISQKALNHHIKNQCPSRMRKEEVPEPMTTEEIASRLVTELANEETEGSVLRSTKGLTVQTGTYVRPYVKKRGKREDDDNDDDNYSNGGKKVKTTKLWICPHCPDYVFERKRDQINHIRSVHGVIKRHVCDQCGKSLEGRSALALHMRIHTGERPFVCATCGRGFSERKTMEDHTRRHTGERPFLCTVCGKDFTFRQSLFRHMKFHSGERPHQCQICGKTFVLKQNLQEHVFRHQKHQLIGCEQCNAKFANKDLLLKHQLKFHVIQSNMNNIEVEPDERHEMRVIDMTDVGVNSSGNYEVTIDSRILDSYAE